MPFADSTPHTPYAPVPVGYSASVGGLVLTGVNQVLSAQNFARKRVIIINPSLANFVDVNFGGPAVVAQCMRLGCLGVGANAGMHMWDSGTGPCPTSSIQVIGTAGQNIIIVTMSS